MRPRDELLEGMSGVDKLVPCPNPHDRRHAAALRRYDLGRYGLGCGRRVFGLGQYEIEG